MTLLGYVFLASGMSIRDTYTHLGYQIYLEYPVESMRDIDIHLGCSHAISIGDILLGYPSITSMNTRLGYSYGLRVLQAEMRIWGFQLRLTSSLRGGLSNLVVKKNRV